MPMSAGASSWRGRGAAENPPNRYEKIVLERDIDWNPEEDAAPATQFYRDDSQTIIAYNDSPDVGFTASVNPYRGCEHGCAYCYARRTHDYLGFSSGIDFETRIMVKENAPALLRRELGAKGWQPQTIAMSGVTDCYQPVERKLRLTRRCLEVLAEFRNPVGIVTKNFLVTRDIDILSELAKHRAAVVLLSITSLDSELAQKLEPRAALPRLRLEAIRRLAEAGIPAGVMTAPIIPGLNDHEIPAILKAAREAGAQWAGKTILRLPETVAPVFEEWLERNVSAEKRANILARIRALRGGKLNDGEFGSRMRGEGIFAEQISQLFHISCRKFGFTQPFPELSPASFLRPGGRQMELHL